jgi:alpha-1,3-mannosyltransferase
MRVLHVVRQFHPSVGGLESVVAGLAGEQRRNGIAAEVLTLDRLFNDPTRRRLPATDQVAGIPVRRIPFAGSRRYPLAAPVLRHLRGFDLVHVHGVDFFSDFLAATQALHNRPLVLSTHGGFFHTSFARRLKTAYFQTVTRAALSRYRRVFACSASDEGLFRRIAADRVTLIENGVDTQKFQGCASIGHVPRFVYFGRFARHKGIEDLLAAFDMVHERRSDTHLLLIGNDWDGSLAHITKAAERGIARGYVSIATNLNDADIAARLGECSYFVSASTYEGFGLTLVEALGAGLVPVVNAIPSFARIVGEAGVGVLTDFSRPSGAAEAMLSAVAATEPQYAPRRHAAIEAAQRYEWPAVERRFRYEYEQVLGIGRRTLLGVQFHVMTRKGAVEALDDALDRQEATRVTFANAHTLRLARGEPALRKVLNESLVLNDGVGVDIASRMKFGTGFPDNLNGTDFVPHFLGATRHPLRLYLLGAQTDVVHKAAEAFGAQWPHHTIVGVRDGFFQSTEAEAICADINRAHPDLLLVALGNPLQEHWLARYGPALSTRLQLGVGALFDFSAGRVSRAPPWMRRARVEWMYRLALEPRRMFNRYVVGNAVFLWLAHVDRRRGFSP